MYMYLLERMVPEDNEKNKLKISIQAFQYLNWLAGKFLNSLPIIKLARNNFQ